MIAHFDWEEIHLVKQIWFTNSTISFRKILLCRKSVRLLLMHMHGSVPSRTYGYHLTTRKDPFQHEMTYRVHFNPDLER